MGGVLGGRAWLRTRPACGTRAALQQALASGCEVAMVTRGDRPVCWLRRGGALQQPPVPQVAAIDTTGAGDVFHAALALAIGEGRAERTAVAFAATAAALKCLGGPGVLGAPARQAVERALPRRPPPSSSPDAATARAAASAPPRGRGYRQRALTRQHDHAAVCLELAGGVGGSGDGARSGATIRA